MVQSSVFAAELIDQSPEADVTLGAPPRLIMPINGRYKAMRDTHGRGILIKRSYRDSLSFSSSYSMFTSQDPSSVGVGQQFTEAVVKLGKYEIDHMTY